MRTELLERRPDHIQYAVLSVAAVAATYVSRRHTSEEIEAAVLRAGEFLDQRPGILDDRLSLSDAVDDAADDVFDLDVESTLSQNHTALQDRVKQQARAALVGLLAEVYA